MSHTQKLGTLTLATAALLLLGGCGESKAPATADLVLQNGVIYTVAGDTQWAQAAAIKDGKYVYVGDNAGAEAFVGPMTQAIDLDGKMAMPGINDAHVHSIEGAAKELFECNFPFSAGPEEIASTVAQCVAEQPEVSWIKGGQWGSDFFVDNQIASPRAFLDEVAPNVAVALSDDAMHNVWFNSRALELVGIDRNTQNPPGVDILRDASGEPTGVVLEVFGFLKEVGPDWTAEQYTLAAVRATELANSFGITGIKDASDTDPMI